jgi:hypothetical protein
MNCTSGDAVSDGVFKPPYVAVAGNLAVLSDKEKRGQRALQVQVNGVE